MSGWADVLLIDVASEEFNPKILTQRFCILIKDHCLDESLTSSALTNSTDLQFVQHLWYTALAECNAEKKNYIMS